MLQDVCLNIMFAGYDTSASALMLLMQLIKKHPQVEKQLREEQAKVREDFLRLVFILIVGPARFDWLPSLTKRPFLCVLEGL